MTERGRKAKRTARIEKSFGGGGKHAPGREGKAKKGRARGPVHTVGSRVGRYPSVLY